MSACSASPGGSYVIDDDDDATPDADPDEDAGRSSSSSSGAAADASVPVDARPDATADAGEIVDAGEADAGDAGEDGGPVVQPVLLRLEGRWDRSNPAVPRTAYPGARIAFGFQGTGVTLRLSERPSYRSDFGTSQYTVTIDGQPAPTLVTAIAGTVEEARDYPLVEGLAAGHHTVQLSRRTEAEFGSTGLVEIRVTGGGLAEAPPARVHRLEIVGDSNTTGYGIEEARPCTNTSSNENWNKTFPALLASRFDAEVQTVSHSGKGVLYNSSVDDPVNLNVLYGLAIPSEPASFFVPSSFPAEAVVVLAGGNDFLNQFPSLDEFQTAYEALIDTIVLAHPDATVFCTVSPGIYDYQNPDRPVRSTVRAGIQGAVASRLALGQKVVFHEFPAASGEELNACDYHSTAEHHAQLASAIGELMATTLAWP